jgi:hypothetical protein
MFEQLGDVALDLFELVEVQVGVGDGKDVAGFGLLINEDAAAFAEDLLFHFEDALAFEHDGKDVTGGRMLRIVLFDEFAEQGFGGVFLDGLDNGRGRVENGLPMGDKAFAVAGAIAELVLPAVLADIHAAEFGPLIGEEGMQRLFIGKRLLAGFACGGAGLNVPFVHVCQI